MARLCVVAALLLCLAAFTQAGELLGGQRKVNVNSPGVRRALAFAMYEYNKKSNDMYQARVVNVNNAERKLVSGYMWYLDVDIGRTQCKKPTTDSKDCEFHKDPQFAKTTTCHFEVCEIPWKGSTEVVTSTCN